MVPGGKLDSDNASASCGGHKVEKAVFSTCVTGISVASACAKSAIVEAPEGVAFRGFFCALASDRMPVGSEPFVGSLVIILGQFDAEVAPSG